MIDNPAGRAEARPSAFASANDPAGARSYIVYFVAGERSGDNHGAALLKALRTRAPKMQFLGRGGPQMRAIAGAKFPQLEQESKTEFAMFRDGICASMMRQWKLEIRGRAGPFYRSSYPTTCVFSNLP